MGIDLQMAWRNLWRQPRRTWLTAGAMIFTNGLMVFLISLQIGMYQLMLDAGLRPMTGHLQVQQVDYNEEQKLRQAVPAVDQLAQTLRADFHSDTVSARGAAFALVSSDERSYGVQVLGVDPRHEPQVSSLPGLVRRGRFLEQNDASEVVVGALLAKNLRADLGDELTLLGTGRDGSFAANVAEIVGIFESGMPDLDRSFVEVPLGYFQDTFAMEGAGHSIVVRADSLRDVSELKGRAMALLPADEQLTVRDWDELQPGLKQSIQGDVSSAIFTYAVLIVLVAFSVLNTQLMSVLERTREFGVVMALGVGPRRLGWLVFLETAFLGLLGAVLGILLGLLILLITMRTGIAIPGMEEMMSRFNLPHRIYPEFSWIGTFTGPVVVYFASLFAAVYPALRLRKLEPVEAMRAAE